MHRISNGTQVAALPAPAAVTGTPGYATFGVVGSLAATTIDADAFNSMQEELVGVVVAGGGTLSKTNNAQVLAALSVIIASKFPASFATNGYVKITTPIGVLIVQWGNTGALNVGFPATVTFPIAFPSSIFMVNPGAYNGGSGTSYLPQITGVTASGFTAAAINGQSFCAYIALGT